MSTNSLGRYKIIREIGRSNDIVYEAVDTSINRRVALKELVIAPNLDGVQRRERIDRFYREARAAGLMSHPNIVTIYEAGEDQGRHFIAMEYLEGQTLRDVIEIEGKVSIEKTAQIATQICDALEYAHSRGVIHRDIKPDNIQILPNNRIKITDFGIARLMDEPNLTSDGQVFGTPSYMSPEQIEGKNLDARTDIFSLGVTLFEMIVGRKPFTGDTVVTITYNIMNQEISIPPTVPPYFDRILRRCLAKDRHIRYGSAAELAADLDHGKYQYAQSADPDPVNTTIGMTNPYYGPTSGGYNTPGVPPPAGTYPTPGPQPDPLAQLQPNNLSLPKPRSKPLMSDDTKYFFKILFVVIITCSALVGFVWLLNAGYQGYQQQTKLAEVNRHIQRGDDYLAQQSYASAIQEYNTARSLNTDPDVDAMLKKSLVSCYVTLGNNYQQKGNWNDAVKAWSMAYQIDPKNPSALEAAAYYNYQLGYQAEQNGNTDLAIKYYQSAQDTAPGSESGLRATEGLRRVQNLNSLR